VLAASIGGCSTTGSNQPLTTSSLAPRPEQGLRTDPPRAYTAESESPRPWTQPTYVPEAYQPRPSTYAQQGYRTQPASGYGQQYAQAPYPPPRGGQNPYVSAETYNQRPYAASPRFAQQQPAYGYGQPNLQTGSLGKPQNVAPITTGSLGGSNRVIEVREGDTLYSLSRRTGVPVADIVSANRIYGGRINIGQRLVIPTITASR
jgi:LysM repeat protein